MMQLTKQDRKEIMQKLQTQEQEAEYCHIFVQQTIKRIANGERKTNK